MRWPPVKVRPPNNHSQPTRFDPRGFDGCLDFVMTILTGAIGGFAQMVSASGLVGGGQSMLS